MVDAAGVMLTDRLRLERKLGEGGVGAVWIAETVGVGTRVAVKLLHKTLLARPDAGKRFVQEARSMAQIDSPHVVRVYDCQLSKDGRPMIVMELLQGEDLKQRLERLGPLPPREVAEIMTQICAALREVHARGIIHRDLKPANVMLIATHEGNRVKVMDFGVAKDPAMADLGLTQTSHFLGTPYYMSPEQLESPKHLDHRADLWSASVLAYELLTGQRPFPGDSLVDVSIAIDAGVFKPPSSIRPELPRALDRLFDRALAKALGARFTSAIELERAFAAAVPRAGSVAAGDRDFAIGPTAIGEAISDERSHTGTVTMEAFDDLASTVMMDDKRTQAMVASGELPQLMATVADPSLASAAMASARAAKPQDVSNHQRMPHPAHFGAREMAPKSMPAAPRRWPYVVLILLSVLALAATVGWWLL